LRVAIYEKCRLFDRREACGQVNGGRSLANTAFLVRYRDNSGQKSPVSENVANTSERCKRFRLTFASGREMLRKSNSRILAEVDVPRETQPSS
jgi:hypothetical protein